MNAIYRVLVNTKVTIKENRVDKVLLKATEKKVNDFSTHVKNKDINLSTEEGKVAAAEEKIWKMTGQLIELEDTAINNGDVVYHWKDGCIKNDILIHCLIDEMVKLVSIDGGVIVVDIAVWDIELNIRLPDPSITPPQETAVDEETT